jgi:hypothetical protein
MRDGPHDRRRDGSAEVAMELGEGNPSRQLARHEPEDSERVPVPAAGAAPDPYPWDMRAQRGRRVSGLGPGRSVAILGGLATTLLMIALVAVAAAVGLADPMLAVPSGATAGVVVAAVLWAGHGVRATQHREAARARRATRELRDQLAERLAEIESEVRLGTLGASYPLPFEMGWAVTPDAAVLLAQEIAQQRPRLVVELGSGVTTLVTGLMLRRLGRGRVVALEHDPAWGARTRRHVAALGLEDVIEVVDAPLIPYDLAAGTYRWYTIPPGLEEGGVDFVDGPPQHVDRQGEPRYPALPLLLPYLSPTASLFVDDAKREAEKAMVERWSTEFPEFRQRRVATRKGAVVVTRAPIAADGERPVGRTIRVAAPHGQAVAESR